ncbi:MAG TPA: methyltransferase domain-containing protein [Chitinophagaceae bacterium]|nr:methyltransferase domain-containing protein [Chitinophagaceae bacterium]
MKNILFISHKKAQCGVYEFGKDICNVLATSKNFNFIRIECGTVEDVYVAVKQHNPAAIIYNYHPSVLPWLATKVSPGIFRNNIISIPVPQIGIIHEITQQNADTATGYRRHFFAGKHSRLSNTLFDYYIAPDPTLLLKNPLVYKTGRLIPSCTNNTPLPQIPTIGSFGFGTPKKGFEQVVRLVQNEFDAAIIRFNIPSADFGDAEGSSARAIAKNCRNIITKKGISLEITHDFFDKQKMLDFLSKNTINIFLYEDTGNRGLSSAVDNALAVRRPVAVSNSIMFRHLHDVNPSVCINDNSIKTIIDNGFAPLEKHYREWSPENLLWEYERIIGSVLHRQKHSQKIRMGIKRTIQSKIRRFFSLPDKTFTWLRNSQKASEDDLTPIKNASYKVIDLPAYSHLNRILDNDARTIYKPAIEKLREFAPATVSKKIEEANVQQAFVLDTVMRFLPFYNNPKLLCVGSYEDTASMSIIKLGYAVEEIDPMLNYYLQEYFTKPTTEKESYDIIFSTSVIEHDPDDESFAKCIAGLLAPGGVAIITCDYKDGWRPRDQKPAVDARLYTREDLTSRLLSYMPGCKLVDEPRWDCPNPDFVFEDCNYTFATFVVKKDTD